ncbi:Mannose-binding lectin [Plasmopara halstedii]|uniref:Mannose-binding lectin n=1 Tax=Plasmopara halstedii TaxID=4781 RepID=A0A0P1ADZ9_PLAHL|nr:Mannose-binding lectin [Plasmopara halstedii]CEG39134.1 Mannose-binding lectin [Plasmopara halstedii]|eukprot:XP_024575503.1 Mannose-binding lectin [Plasmopara halstedii]
MKICFSFLATLAFVQGDMYDLPDFVEKCTVTGGPHGRPFDDTSMVVPGQKVTKITLCHGDRVDGIGITFVPPEGMSQDPFHGSKNKCHDHDLASDEYIKYFEVQTTKTSTTRIGYIRLMTNTGRYIEGGKERKGTAKKEGCKAPDDNHQLAAFFGREGEEIDAIGPVWTLRNPVEVVPGQPPSGPEQKML